MVSLPVDVLLGLYLGALVGVCPALGVWAASFGFRYREGLSLPRAGAVGIGLVVAAANAAVLVVVDEPVLAAAGPLRLALAVGVVVAASLYAHSKGDTTAEEFPRRLSLTEFTGQGIATDRAELIDDGAEVRIRVVGAVTDVDGYPALPEELRAEIANAEFELPADLRLSELERRVADRLETTYDLATAEVDIDERGRAQVAAAPPFSGLSKRVGGGRHAVTVSGLVPTGIARGDEVTVITPGAQVRGTVISARSAGSGDGQTPRQDIEPRSDDDPADGEEVPRQVRTPTTDGGEGQVTVAVTRTDVQPLLRASETKIVVESRELDREYEVVSMLRRAGHQIKRIAVRPGSRLAGTVLGRTDLREEHDVAVLAVRKENGWLIAPDGETRLETGDELFAAGTRENLTAFESGGV
ncbi:potassium transporter TrkA [Halovenus sp. WSH3]|uniref:Potassium transporter TrkA n=1 Tax=Halovenus carboxidivorans TaxID=2692199 RepID=A0A6B0T0G7_9EURY|nr:TrkA C-terminal domain-containing protein [Halovenus carboxidivorans]MXR51668.1 potassium transporter TrkA [Halovenus carboxidivorans]